MLFDRVSVGAWPTCCRSFGRGLPLVVPGAEGLEVVLGVRTPPEYVVGVCCRFVAAGAVVEEGLALPPRGGDDPPGYA